MGAVGGGEREKVIEGRGGKRGRERRDRDDTLVFKK